MDTGVEGFRFSLMMGVLGWSAAKSESRQLSSIRLTKAIGSRTR